MGALVVGTISAVDVGDVSGGSVTGVVGELVVDAGVVVVVVVVVVEVVVVVVVVVDALTMNKPKDEISGIMNLDRVRYPCTVK